MKNRVIPSIVLLILCATAQNLRAQPVYVGYEKIYKMRDTLYNATGNAGESVRVNGYALKKSSIFQAPGMQALITTHYPGFRWDLGFGFVTAMTYFKVGPELGRELQDVSFQTETALINPKEYIQVEKETQDAVKDISSISEKIMIATKLRDPIDRRHVVSKNLTGIGDFLQKRMFGSRNAWAYDLVLDSDNQLYMPVLFGDSLYTYKFQDQSWKQAGFAGAASLGAQDVWLRQGGVAFPVKPPFRAVIVHETLYLIAAIDALNTGIYRYTANTITLVGKLTHPSSVNRMLLIDRDDDIVYFVQGETLEIDDAGKKHFKLLRPDAKLTQAVQKLMLTR